jgi:hypothetical protein
MKKLIVSLSVLFLITPAHASLQNFYTSHQEQELEVGVTINNQLKDTVKRAAKHNFHPLGYKKGAKKELFGETDLHQDSDGFYVKDVYCNIIVRNKVGPNKIPKNNVINVEHTWPQSKGSKREPARGDLHHLFPANSRANSTRGNHPFGEVLGEDVAHNCIDSQKGKIISPTTGKITGTHGYQPPLEHRGNVARAMFYVSAVYNYDIPAIEEYYLRKWHKEDPVDLQEMLRNDAIEKAQGNRNPFIDFPSLVDRISNL